MSVGSLYQYFPNKQALLFRLQADEWDDTWSLLDELLSDVTRPPLERLRRVVVTFFRSEHEEATLRTALSDAGAVLRGSPEERAHRARIRARALAFVEEVAPSAPPSAQAFAAEWVFTTMSALGERVTSTRRSRAEIDRWANATADALVAFLARLAKGGREAR